ncbi:AmmeMemoRadiSam system protein A [candidate division WWE3 bacterium CG08_land_8_20_14_0_20_43_13]|uniref:AmmeMemoRadiSam system protein A n=1 Tax=candidate division WWE3 bacterium CG08_land_8_20_14_0_20_43_13 TaxID=1975087 RepID=A0A2H0X6S9_UNCKA|nr:MAG: AmmeMemoRadiSam system protein A [candidate division WWE3 bacterium CG08_land_8_20_14_0_20_43_13]
MPVHRRRKWRRCRIDVVLCICMQPLTEPQQRYLLFLARRAVEYSFQKASLLQIAPKNVPYPELQKEQGCFVSLHTTAGQLRGCVGCIFPKEPLYLAVIHNALAAAFEDSRFPMLRPVELEKVIFEVSVLTTPQPLVYAGQDQLLSYLSKKHPGIVLRLGDRLATFLPQVWEELLEPVEFLSHLSKKAGLDSGAWRLTDVTMLEYEAQVFCESAPGYFP